MGQVLIRNLPDDLIETYKTKARLKGISLEQELRDTLEAEAQRPYTPQERLAIFQQNMARFKTPVPSLTLDEIRDGLEGAD
jgi:antitoxin FitA